MTTQCEVYSACSAVLFYISFSLISREPWFLKSWNKVISRNLAGLTIAETYIIMISCYYFLGGHILF